MAFWIIIILGIVQGATEFLPVSSSGHLVLFYNIFGITGNTILLSVILHVATLFAVVFVYYKDIAKLIKNPFCKTNKLLVVATIPTILLVLLFKKFIEESFGGQWLIIGFIITAIVLVVAEYMGKKNESSRQNVFRKQAGIENNNITNLNISYKQGIVIGVAQGLASFPGISRSGSTIAAGLMAGVSKNEVANFSFLLSIPIILASLGYEMLGFFTEGGSAMAFNFGALSVGFLFAFISGLLCIKLMLAFVKKQKLTWFSLYLLALSTFMVLNTYVFHLF